MRIGFFTECYHPIVNGVVASVDALALGLRSAGHEVYCFTPKVPGFIETDGPVFRMPSLPLPAGTPYRLTLPLVSKRNRDGIIKRLDIIHAHSPFVTGWMGVRYARRYGIPIVYTYHTQLEEYAHYFPFQETATRRAATTLTRGFANSTDAVIVPTCAMRDRLRAVGVTTALEIVPSGIDVAHFAAGRRDEAVRRACGIQPGQRMAVFVSRLAREKNIDLLLEALAFHPDPSLRLVIAGDGPERDRLEQRAGALGIAPRTKFLGAVERTRLPDLYASADAFVFPSVSETQGLVLAEALAAGAYVIAVDTPQNRDVMAGSACLVEPNAAAFSAALESIPAAADPERMQSARFSASRFGIAQQTDRIEALYSRLLRRREQQTGS
ncbi:MAG: glycosyltransferase [Candidatus Eremiobacteraeota bacterium]|nr:glycosyltransferase [Candidatus Eremiobacteraeota bacterium]